MRCACCPSSPTAPGTRLRTNANSPFDWVPESVPPAQEYEQFRRAFGSGEVLIVSWPGCTIDSPSLDCLTKSLRRPDLFRDAAGRPLVEHVVTGRGLRRGSDGPVRCDCRAPMPSAACAAR